MCHALNTQAREDSAQNYAGSGSLKVTQLSTATSSLMAGQLTLSRCCRAARAARVMTGSRTTGGRDVALR